MGGEATGPGIGGVRDFALAMYHSNGSLDTTFGAGTGKSTLDFAGGVDRGFGLVVQSDGKLVLGGEVAEPAAAGD